MEDKLKSYKVAVLAQNIEPEDDSEESSSSTGIMFQLFNCM